MDRFSFAFQVNVDFYGIKSFSFSFVKVFICFSSTDHPVEGSGLAVVFQYLGLEFPTLCLRIRQKRFFA